MITAAESRAQLPFSRQHPFDHPRAILVTLPPRDPFMLRDVRLLTRRRDDYPMHMLTQRRQWTADDLEDLPDDGRRYEIIDGELFVSPSPSLPHQEAVLRLYRLSPSTSTVSRSDMRTPLQPT